MHRTIATALGLSILLVTVHAHAQAERTSPAPAASPDMTSPAVPGKRMVQGLSAASPQRDIAAWENEPLPRRDIFQMISGGSTQAPASYWLDREKELFGKLLALRKAEILVAPFQVQGFGFDRATRSLMQARLAERMGANALNPYIVQRAFGDGARQIPQNELYALADAVDARRMLIIHVGYERRDRLLVTARLGVREGGSWWFRPEAMKSWTDRTFSDEIPPASAFRALIPEILAFAGVGSDKPAATRSKLASPGLPKNMTEAQHVADRDLLSRALMLQWLGTLSPALPARQRERMFEQALLALDALADSSAADAGLIAVLRARCLYNLNSRPAALAALGVPATPEGRSVLQYLNGNLPQMEEAVAKVADPLLRLMLEIDLQDMRDAYGLPVKKRQSAFVEATLQKYPEWKFLVSRRLTEGDAWSVQDNLELKLTLDREFPIPGFDAKAMGRGSMVLGKGLDTDGIGLSVFEHVRRARQTDGPKSLCRASPVPCLRDGYLDLLEAIAISNAVRGIYRMSELQANGEAAARYADQLAKVLDGQPDFLAVRGRAYLLESMRQGGSNTARDDVQRVSAAAAYLERGQSKTSHDALVNTSPRSWLPFRAAYIYDFPPSRSWLDSMRPEIAVSGGRVLDAKSALAYSAFDIAPAKFLLASQLPDDKQFGLAELEKRFRGHPARAELVAGNTVGVDAEIARLETARKERPDLWDNYFAIGRRQIEQQGDYAAAARTYLSFPGFKDPKSYDKVALSNYAYEAGSLFFWSGRLDDATKLYKIAADLNTGSNASLTSELRLELLNGNYEKTAELSLNRARRYESEYAYRDYLSWLFAMGYADDAWAGFGRLHARLANPQVWLAAYVGHRMERKNWNDLRTWLLTEPIRNSGHLGEKFALTYAVMLNSIDRMPSADLPELLTTIEGEPKGVTEPGTNTIRMPHAQTEGMMNVRRSAFRVGERGAFKAAIKVPSQQYLFAQGYLALRSGKFDEAVERFDTLAGFYPIEGDYLAGIEAYPLAYFAWASAKAGDKLGLERFLSGLPESHRRFDYHLAMAFFTGLRGEVEASRAHLESALNTRPFTEHRPIFTEYQWAEACDWLFEATGDPKYRDMAIKWAKVNQQVQPMNAWAYTMEAKLTTSDADRIRALGFALYLDPLSERIAKFPEETRQRAKTWFAANDPFKPTANASKKQKV